MPIPEEEIEKIVWMRYPKDPEERTCAQKRHALGQLRNLLRQKLRDYEPTAESAILDDSQKENGAI